MGYGNWGRVNRLRQSGQHGEYQKNQRYEEARERVPVRVRHPKFNGYVVVETKGHRNGPLLNDLLIHHDQDYVGGRSESIVLVVACVGAWPGFSLLRFTGSAW